MGRRPGAWLLALSLTACGGATELTAVPQCAGAVPLTAADVRTVIAQAAARALADGQAFLITVVNREGIVVGSLRMAGAPLTEPDAKAGAVDPALAMRDLEFFCRAKARTAAFLSSNQHAFNTRTARFIIQNNFPPDVPNAPGGPLYGVQFSSLACSDTVGEALAGAAKLFTQEGNSLSDDTGSMPLFKGGCLVGGVAVDGGAEPDDVFEERAAWTAAAGFRPAASILGSLIHIDGIRVEFMEETPPDDVAVPAYADLLAGGATELTTPVDAPASQAFPMADFGGVPCEIRYPVIGSARPVPATERLSAADVDAMLDAAAARSQRVRAGIRRPLGTAMQCFVSIVDRDGTILGSIRTPDATLFSFDVSIQKARTSAFFSTDTFGMTCRAMGFVAQGFFPPGIDFAPRGPFANDFHFAIDQRFPFADALPGPADVLALQDAYSLTLFVPLGPGGTCRAPIVPELPNGFTIFPGGVPLYKNGVLVGAAGVSGDGVDQDDFIASAAGDLFPPPPGVRCDEVSESAAVAALRARLGAIRAAAAPFADAASADPFERFAQKIVDAADDADARFAAIGLQDIRLPYVKFPRQPFIDN